MRLRLPYCKTQGHSYKVGGYQHSNFQTPYRYSFTLLSWWQAIQRKLGATLKLVSAGNQFTDAWLSEATSKAIGTSPLTNWRASMRGVWWRGAESDQLNTPKELCLAHLSQTMRSKPKSSSRNRAFIWLDKTETARVPVESLAC